MEYIKLGDICSIKTGRLDANAASPDGLYPFFTCSKEPLKINEFSYDCECVLIAGNGDLNVKYYNGKFDAYQRTYIIEVKNKELFRTKYIYLLVMSKLEDLRKKSIGGVIKYIKLGDLSNIPVPNISKSKQDKTINSLFKFFEIISIKRNQITKLNELVKSQFIEMFGNINNKQKIKLLNNYFSRGKSPNYVDNSKIGVINQACIYWDYFKMENIKHQDESKINNLTEKMIRKNDILITSTGTGTLGRCNVYIGENNKYIADGHVSILRLKEKIINPIYFKYYLMQDKVQKQLYSECVNGSTNQIELSKDKFLNFNVFVPNIELQKKFAHIVEEIDKQKFSNKNILELLVKIAVLW